MASSVFALGGTLSIDGSGNLVVGLGVTGAMLKFGGITSSFPALKASGSVLEFKKADDSAYTGLNAQSVNPVSGGSYLMNAAILAQITAPTISSGFGSGPSIVANNGTAVFTVNVGTGGAASSGIIGLPAAATGWILNVMNLTALLANRADQRTVQTATTTNTATVQNQTISTGAALAWTASDILLVSAFAY